ncbi:retrovirus-related pol polyprotein from transposon TNT 1-94 [Tanacetum coccineum]
MTDQVANLDKENQTNKMVNESLTAELERYKERVAIFEQRINADSNNREKLIDSQMDDLIRKRNAKFAAFDSWLSKSEAQRIKPTLYDGSVIAKEHDVISVINDEETLILEEEIRSKMFDKQNNPISIKNNISPIDYSKLNKIKEDFVEAPRELPKVSLVNESLKKLRYQLAKIDKAVKNRTTSDAITPAQSQEKDMVIRKLKEKIKSLSGKAIVKNVKKDIDEMETINIELEHSVAKLLSENKNLRKEREHLKSIYKDQFDSIKKTRVRSKEHSDSLISQINAKFVENSDLNAQLQEKSTGVKCSTSASGSKLPDNIKNNRITQSSIRNKINKVEDQSRSVKSRKNKMNRVDKTECNAHVMQSVLNAIFVSEPISNALVKHSMRNAKFESMCAICNKCLFDANHDMCLIDYAPVEERRVVQIVLWYLDSGCSKHMTGNRSQLINFVSKFLGTVKFGNDHIAKIIGYGDYQMGNVTISQVYYVEGLGHNLFSIGHFCNSDLEVAFQKHTCFIRDLDSLDLLQGLRGLVRGLPKLKYQKDHLCSACALGKSKKHSYKPKAKDSIQEKLYLLHMDLCEPMRIQSINGRKYILVIVDDYSWFTWVKFLRSKDEVSMFVIKFLKMIHVRLNATVRNIQTDNDTEFFII